MHRFGGLSKKPLLVVGGARDADDVADFTDAVPHLLLQRLRRFLLPLIDDRARAHGRGHVYLATTCSRPAVEVTCQ